MDPKPKRRRRVDDDAKLAEAIFKIANAVAVLAHYATTDDNPTVMADIHADMDAVVKSVASVNAGRALKPTPEATIPDPAAEGQEPADAG